MVVRRGICKVLKRMCLGKKGVEEKGRVLMVTIAKGKE